MVVSDISAHVIMPPSLERGSRIVSVLAVYLDEFVEHAPCEVEVFVAEVLAQDQKYLSLVSMRSICVSSSGPDLWYPVSILVVPRYVRAVPH